MSVIWMDVDAALAEVPVNVAPLLDDGDFKTIEASVAYNAAGMALNWHFVTTAGAYTVTAVTPTTGGGDYDWTNQGQGLYSLKIPASGGASINNATEGFGYFTGFVTGVLPWRGPTIGFRAAGLNNLLIDDAFSATRGLTGTAVPAAAADAPGGLPISDGGGLDLDAKLANTNEVTAARMGALTDWIDGGRLDLIIDAILDDTDLIDDGTSGLAKIATDVAAILVDTGTTLDGKIDTIDGIVDSILADTGTDGVVIATGQTVTALTITTLTVTNNAIGWNANWDAEVQSEVDDGLIAKGLDHLVFTSVTGTDIADNSIIAKIASKSATADWDSFLNTSDSLEAQADAASAGVTVSVVVPTSVLNNLNTNNAITIIKYDSLSNSFTALGNVVNKTETYFFIKQKKTDADSAAIIKISESGGLITLEGAAYGTSGHGSYAWTNTTTGAATLTLDETATGLLTARKDLYFAIKVIRSTGAANTLIEGTCDILDGIIRAVS